MLKERMAADQGGYHDRTRRKILKVAHKLYTAAGYASVSMREVAKRMGFSAQAIYYYFPIKEAMFAAPADEGLRLLEAQHPSEELADSFDNLRLPYLRYYDFSKAHPEYFTLLWMDTAAADSQQEPQVALILRMSEDVHRRMRRCIAEGLLPPDLDLVQASSVLFSAVHGPAVVGLTGRPPTEGLDAIARHLLDSAILGLQAGMVRQAPGTTAAPSDTSATVAR
jgi:AcrR family transcriptional regulator